MLRILVPFLALLLVGSPALVARGDAEGRERAQLPEQAAAPLRDRVKLGAYVPGVPYFEHGTKAFVALEKKLGTKLPIVSGFIDWDYVLGGPRDLALADGGKRVLLYSWEPHCAGGSTEDQPTGCVGFAAVARGEKDAYLQAVAASMKKFPHIIYVRPWGEMNADWSAWQPGSKRPRAGTAAEFIAAWRHVRDLFKREGVDNLKFIFNPDANNDATTVDVRTIWPGAEYVDVLGIDGYNWGKGAPGGWGVWEEFEQIFAPMYRVLTDLHPTAPVWICEVGSKEPQKADGVKRPSPKDPTHSKAKWLASMLESKAFPRLEALVYFNVDKERDFRLESSPEALGAVKKQLRLRKTSERPSPTR